MNNPVDIRDTSPEIGAFTRFYEGISSSKLEELRAFRNLHPERSIHVGQAEWRYRILGADTLPTLVLLPGGELVNDLGFQFAMAMSDAGYRIVYPAYPRVSSLAELADGLAAVLDAEQIQFAAVLGASFGAAAAQVLVRRHPQRVRKLILSNCGVPMRRLVPAVWTALALARTLPWSTMRRLLARGFVKVVDPRDEQERRFWVAYVAELMDTRLGKADLLANMALQLEYHRRYRFQSSDLANWAGSILIAESDNDVIGPSRRKGLRDTYPAAKVHTFHNGGHATMFLRFDEYLAMVKDFLQL